MKIGLKALSVFTGGLMLLSSYSAFAGEREEYVVSTRQGALKLMGFYMGPLGGMARGKIPMDAAVVANNAQRIASLAPMLTDTFKLNTSASGIEKTEALPVIWEETEEFAAKIATLTERAEALQVIAAGDDEGAIKGGIAKLGGACGSCHDDFRVKKDE